MEIILKEDFPSLGYVGDRVKVRRGYARNYLIPRGIGIEASTHNVRMLNHIVAGISAKRNRLKGQAEEIAKKLETAKLEFVLKVGEKGKSFGSITTKDIETSLKAQGHAIDRKQIRLNDAIRKAGEFKASIKLHSEVTVNLPIKVALESTSAARKLERGEDVTAGDKPKRKRSAKKKGDEDQEASAPEGQVPAASTEDESSKGKKAKKPASKKEAE